MRIARLNLAKFAMFTGTELELLPEGVNVIVGANEAGKTTTMAAIHQLLYGIPVRSEHSYLHSNPDLRIGGVLRDNDGHDLEVYRIKRKTDTLRTATDSPIADAVLVELLGGVEEGIYAQLFSISHEEIVTGGTALLDSEGDLGRALFGAGTGLTQLNAVMSRLGSRAGELFKSGASKPRINADIARYKDLVAAIKEHAQSAAAVEQLDKALKQAEKQLAELDQDFQHLSVELSRATRVRSTRAQIQRRRQNRQELSDLDALGPRVAPEIPALLTAAQEARRTGSSGLATLVPDLDGLTAKLAHLSVDELLIAQADVVEQLLEELGGIRQNLKDLPGLNKQVGDLEREIEGHLRRLPAGCRLDPGGMPAISDVERSRIERLSKEWITIDAGLATSRKARDVAQLDRTDSVKALANLSAVSDVSNLSQAVKRVRGEGPLEATADELAQQAATLLSGIEASISGLGLTIGPRDADKLALPTTVRVNEVDGHVSSAQSAVESALEQSERLNQELADLDGQLSGLLQRTDPPSLDELDQSRTHRDDGWHLIRAAWLDNATQDDLVAAWSGGQSLDRVYEAAVTESDDIADRLRRDAEAVERRALLEQQLADKRTAIDQHVSVLDARNAEHETAVTQWRELWAAMGVEAAGRAAMDEFLATARDLGTQAANLRTLETTLAERHSTIRRCASDLRGLLGELGDKPDESLSLVALLERAEGICTKADAVGQERRLAEQNLDNSSVTLDAQNDAVDAAETSLGAWELEWTEALAPPGVPAATTPADVSSLLATLRQIEEDSSDLDEKRRRVEGMERRNLDVEEQVSGVIAALPHLALDLTDTEVTINSLHRLLRAGQNDATTQASLLDQHQSKERDVNQARETVTTAEAEIAGLIVQSGVADEQALVEAVERTNRAAALTSVTDELESNLLDATGMALDQLADEVDAAADDDLDTLIADLSSRRDGRDQERSEVAQTVGGLRSNRKSIDDSDEAAVAAEQAQLALSDVANNTDEYVRVTLARHLLEQQIAQYRAENQGPILGRASEIFRHLTLDGYTGIDTDADDKGQLVILAKRASGGSLGVSALSTGTRDQLYLSMRIAALEHYAVGIRNLPLLLDDLFVHFDDDRTRAGLGILEQLSSKMQVLLFTHHERVADQATEAIAGDKLKVQVLTN